MKRPLATALAFASIAAVSVTGFGMPTAHASTPATGVSAAAAASTTTDVSAMRQKFNAYVAGMDLDAATRTKLEAAGASDAAFTAAGKVAVATLQAGLTNAGVDRDANPALNPGDYECGPTAMNAWVKDQVAQIDPTSWSWYTNGILGLSPDLLVQYWTLMKTPSAPRDTSFGPSGSATNEMARTFGALQNFWDIDGSGIALVSYDAKLLADTPEAAADRAVVYDGISKISGFASILLRLSVESGILSGTLAGFPGGVDNPMFSVNSFAIDPTHATGDDKATLDMLGVTRRIAMGQGLIRMWDDLGLGRVGDRAVLAHEYSHQVQYDDNLFVTDITDEAEATARTELMADAFGTYFTVSKHGESLNKAQTLQDLQTFYNVGDCGFSNPGHHGTPNQRYRAAEWGADLAKSQSDQGHVLPSLAVDAAFEKALPQITAPDAN
ncbi:MAG TPA: hypothetical protein VG502_06580 [Flexivirga sp.]|uniref:hypothetical protein n=1 Tax=Flexivirga sp. TaxID=1962927 RepID=UPI002C0D9FEF|nr:hypothetical protein [Flexivirga sp.]HWC21949.1 hypothetical protein [Flexivirga sp.]